MSKTERTVSFLVNTVVTLRQLHPFENLRSPSPFDHVTDARGEVAPALRAAVAVRLEGVGVVRLIQSDRCLGVNYRKTLGGHGFDEPVVIADVECQLLCGNP